MKPEILSSMRCPITESALEIADAAAVERINSAIAAGKAKAYEGGSIEVAVEGGLLNSDRSWFVPLRDGIYCFNMESLIQISN